MKEDDEVDNLDIKLDVKRKSKRVYQSSASEVNLKINRSLKILKHEWLARWQRFIPDLVRLCRNILRIGNKNFR